MCGISGAISTFLSQPEVATFRDLMMVSVLRGSDGAGLIAVPRDTQKPITVEKSVGTAAGLAASYKFSDAVKDTPSLLIGHARLPTRGDITEDHVHPHSHGDIIGIHNGTMQTVMGRKVEDGESDSSLLIKAIAEHPLQDVIDNSEGAYALVWLDKKARRVHFLRNKDRPLFFASSPGTMYWSSEHAMLQFILTRNGGVNANGKWKYTYLKEYSHFHCPVNASGLQGGVFEQMKEPPKKQKTPPIMVTTTSGEQSSDRGQNYDDPFLRIMPNHYVSEASLRKLLEETACSWGCNTTATMSEYHAGRVFFIDKDQYVCKECADRDPIAGQYALDIDPSRDIVWKKGYICH